MKDVHLKNTRQQTLYVPRSYDIEADWVMFTTCNYACKYCFFDAEQLSKKLQIVASNHQWQQAFDKTGLTWLIHLTGGEPFILPDFVELCSLLTQKHFISLNSNLTRPAVEFFAKTIDPNRVSLINAGFHPIERAERRGYDAFIKHFHLLRKHGFNVIASMVGDPKALADFDTYRKMLEPEGIVLVPKVMRGNIDDKNYPSDYSAQDRTTFKNASEAARLAYAPMLESFNEAPTINPFNDDAYLEETLNFRGMMCSSSSRFVIVNEKGDVIQCPSKVVGNLLDGTFRRAEDPIVCNSSYCFYFCMKYADTTEAKPIIELRRSTLTTVNTLKKMVKNFK